MIYVIVNDWVPDINISFKKTQIFFEIDFSIHFPSYENNIAKTPFPSDVHIILTNSTGINSISRANPIVIDATCLEILKSDLFTFSTRFRFFFFQYNNTPKNYPTRETTGGWTINWGISSSRIQWQVKRTWRIMCLSGVPSTLEETMNIRQFTIFFHEVRCVQVAASVKYKCFHSW